MDNPPTPSTVFQRAASEWEAQRLPAYVQFVGKVEDQVDPVLIVVRTRDGAAYTQTLPEPQCRTTSPATHIEGTSVEACQTPKPIVVPGAKLTGPYGSPLGFCFTRAHCTGVLHDDPFAPAQSESDGAPVIASVHAYGNAYEISFGSRSSYVDRPVYDLVMRPRLDPKRYQLREMLIDASNYRTYEITYDVPRVDQRDFLLRYDFGPVNDFWYLQYICVYIPPRFQSDEGGC